MPALLHSRPVVDQWIWSRFPLTSWILRWTSDSQLHVSSSAVQARSTGKRSLTTWYPSLAIVWWHYNILQPQMWYLSHTGKAGNGRIILVHLHALRLRHIDGWSTKTAQTQSMLADQRHADRWCFHSQLQLVGLLRTDISLHAVCIDQTTPRFLPHNRWPVGPWLNKSQCMKQPVEWAQNEYPQKKLQKMENLSAPRCVRHCSVRHWHFLTLVAVTRSVRGLKFHGTSMSLQISWLVPTMTPMTLWPTTWPFNLSPTASPSKSKSRRVESGRVG